MAVKGKGRRKGPRTAVGLLVRVKYEQVDEFISRFACNISPGGMFIQSPKPHPKGTLLRFQIQLKGGQAVLKGVGQVVWTRGKSEPGEKPQVAGMGVKFVKLDDASKAVIRTILEVKAGLRDLPTDKDKAKDEPESPAREQEDVPPKAEELEKEEKEEKEEKPSQIAPPAKKEGLSFMPSLAPEDLPVPPPDIIQSTTRSTLPPEDPSHLGEMDEPKEVTSDEIEIEIPIEMPAMESAAQGLDVEVDIPIEAPSVEIPVPPPEATQVDEVAASQTEALSADIDVEIDFEDLGDLEAAGPDDTEISVDLSTDSASLDVDVDMGLNAGLDIAVDTALGGGMDVDLGVDLSDEDVLGDEFDVDISAEEDIEVEIGDDIDVDIATDDEFSAPPGTLPPRPGITAPTGGVESKVIGIDLGTTNSCAAVVVDGKPKVIPTRRGYRTIPSMVAYTDDGRFLVGHPAKAQMEINPRNTVYGSKRLMGRAFGSPAVQQMKDRFQYQIVEGPNHEVAVHIVGRNFSLQQVAAFVLTEIRDVARELLQEEVNRAVITVPAYFNENQRKAVREAGILAGITVERIVTEPTAAALAYGYNRSLDQRIMVFDLGGGTFDVSIMELCDNVYEVMATGGDAFLGGVDFDNQLMDYLLDAFCTQVGQVPVLDRSSSQRLRDAAEMAKCALSEKDETIVRLPFFAAVDNTPKDLEVRVSRALLEKMVEPLVERTIEVAGQVLEKAKLKPENLDNILLVGGQSRMPVIQKRIVEVFGSDPHKGVHPDEAVAIGAALLADSAGKIDSVVLIDVLPVSIGIGLPGGRSMRILNVGTALPVSKMHTIRTFKDSQEELELSIFQGESDRVVDNEYLGTVNVTGIDRAPKGAIQLEIMFSLNQECLLKISSRQVVSGKSLGAKMGSSDSDESLRRKLEIPLGEMSLKQIGVPVSLRQANAAQSGEGDGDEEASGLLGKLFKKKK